MKTRILRPGDPEWDETLHRLPLSDVYFRSSYHAACEANGDGEAYAFVVESGDALLFHPFLLRSLEDGRTDLESAYGYTGPLCSGAAAERLAAGWREFASWCASRRVVAEFVRFNPLLGNVGCADPAALVARDRETVAVRLDVSAGELWNGYPQRHRNMVRKAERRGLVAAEEEVAAGLPAFRRLYDATMANVGAAAAYSFSDAYFDSLAHGLGDGLRLFTVRAEGELAAAALFLLHGPHMHYHLAGSDRARRTDGANNLLLHVAAEWGRARGLRILHLGGGRTASPDDSLLRFKAGVSRDRLAFHTARIVRDRGAYDELCDRWLREAAVERRPDYFLLYRLPPR